MPGTTGHARGYRAYTHTTLVLCSDITNDQLGISEETAF